MGLEMRDAIADELIKELIGALKNPEVHYLDLILQDYDHVAHHTGDRASQLQVIKELDGVVGRVWTAIQNSPEAETTALVMVSDHGMNTDQQIYSQGFNLVRLLGSTAGGGHHVATKRRLLLDYAIKGLNPFYYYISTSSPDSYYLKGQNGDYPTAMLDFDGNERASIHLRDSDLNLLHLILQQLRRKDLPESLKRPLADAFFSTVERRRVEWQAIDDELKEEMGALHRSIEKQTALWQQQPKKVTAEKKRTGRDEEIRRIFAQLNRWQEQERDYSEYATILANLLALRREGFEAAKVRIEDVIPKRAMGEQNNIHQLQDYVVGVSASGLVLDAAGSLDMQRSFTRVNYPSLLHDSVVRDNVQPRVSNHTIDFVALTIPAERLKSYFADLDTAQSDVIWLYGGDDKQALIFAREDNLGQLSFRYQPIKDLQQDVDGRITLETIAWQPGLPLEMVEDPALSI